GGGASAPDEAQHGGAAMTLAIDCVEERPAFEPQLLHPLQEGRECAGFPLTIAGRAELLQSVDLASQPAQSEGVLQVHPEAATTIGETGDLVDGEDNRDHGAASCTAVQSTRAARF